MSRRATLDKAQTGAHGVRLSLFGVPALCMLEVSLSRYVFLGLAGEED